MSTLTIASPGVQINEVDQSLLARPIGGTDVLIMGFADQGPTDEFINISNVSDFEDTFGTPTNAAERYLYYTAKELLVDSPANLLVSRLPYGPNEGTGYSNTYSALCYTVNTDQNTYENSKDFILNEPVNLILSDEDYQKILDNDIPWSTVPGGTVTNIDDIGNSAFVIINKTKAVVNNVYEGYYAVVFDNSNYNPSTAYQAVQNIVTVDSAADGSPLQGTFVIPTSAINERFNFQLTEPANSIYSGTSLSKAVETYPLGYEFTGNKFKDCVAVVVFKLKASQYSQDTLKLDYQIVEGHIGSFYANRTQNNQNGGKPSSLFIDTVVAKGSNKIATLTNPNISKTGNWYGDDGNGTGPLKQVQVDPSAMNAYASGVYKADTDVVAKDIGNVPLKVDRVLNLLQNNDSINVDILAEAGLGTIWAGATYQWADITNEDTTKPRIFDEAYTVDLGELKNTDGSQPTNLVYESYINLINNFVTFASSTRKDHVFIADPLRYIFVQGENAKISSRKSFIFSNDIYWPLKNLYSTVNSSYVVTYGNWVKTYDAYTDKEVWIPSSGYAAAAFAKTSQQSYPWIAPAGFTRGVLNNVTAIAVNPNQKQRDLLYKVNINPIAYFSNDGFVIYGQKTLFKQPSAFDRVNVRRLFLTLEKEAQALLKYFVFEPNTFATRNRLKGSLIPIFDQAKLNDGLYDYLLICDETNNTPDVIDNNELKISIYIQPVRAAEFILADFIATRTGVNFSELIG
jgi:hypothetical protein